MTDSQKQITGKHYIMNNSMLTTGLLALTLGLGRANMTPAGEAPPPPLLIHVGGTMRPAMDIICKLFEQETGIKVEMNYNDSGAIITVIETTGKGDACIVHDPFPADMEKKGWVEHAYPVASLTPVIAVKKGNPKTIRTVSDLLRPEVKVGLTDRIYSTGGQVAAAIFKQAGIADAMDAREKEIVRTRGGGELANAVSIGTLDAAIVWNAVVFSRKDTLEAIPIHSSSMPTTQVVFLTFKRSTNSESVRKLAELVNSDRGRAIFTKLGFSSPPATAPLPGEKLEGAILVYCAAGMKEPVSEIARQFEKKTGVKIELTFASSGQLLGQIQTTHIGEVYIPGEVDFAAQAVKQNLTLGEPVEFCQLLPVILVKKGNPKVIRELADLSRLGLKLALADASSAIGKVQLELFKMNGLAAGAIRKNTVYEPAMVTDVALAVKLGTVDAGLVWDAVGAQYSDATDMVRIPADKNRSSRVAACALAGARNPNAAKAFVEYLDSREARTVLSSKGFGYNR